MRSLTLLDLFLDIIGTTGKKFINFVANIGHFFIFFGNALYWVFKPPWYFKKIFQQILDIGYFSLPVVGLTTFFSGMVLAKTIPEKNVVRPTTGNEKYPISKIC